MRIGVIGTGRVGSTLARAWAERGHDVTFGSRDPTSDAVAELVGDVPGAHAAGLQETVAGADVIVLAVPGAAAEAVARSLSDWDGKVIVDPTNPLRDDGPSNAEAVQSAAEGAHVVKAFNVIGVEAMARAARGEAGGTMPLAGDDEEAVATTAQLAREIGLEPLHVGGVTMATSLEELAWVWIAWSRTLGRTFLWRVER